MDFGDDLANHARFRVAPEKSEWAYNWDYAECSTANPTPRPGHGTLWIVANKSSNPVRDVVKLFRDAGSALGVRLQTKDVKNRDEGVSYCKLTVVNRKTKAPVLAGTVDTSETMDPYCGKFATFKSTTFEGLSLMEKIVASSAHGFSAMLEHSRVELTEVAGPNYRLVVETGEGPDDAEEDGGGDDDENEGAETCSMLATRFFLYESDEVVAQAHLSYRDGSWDPSFGPTIEMMAVKRSHRGRGLLKVLWHWVRYFIEENFTIECLNNDAPHGHIMIKATQLTGTEVEARTSSKSEKLISVSDKDFFFNHYGFSVRELKGAMSFMFSGRRPPDEEAVLYIPLLSREDIRARRTQQGGHAALAPAPGSGKLPKQHGAKVCECCRKIGKRIKEERGGLQACARCKTAFYCCKACQTEDWKRHKLWCGKSRKQIHKKLKQEGRIIKDKDGNVTTVVGPMPRASAPGEKK